MPVKDEAYADWPGEDVPVRLPWQLDTEWAGFGGGMTSTTRWWHRGEAALPEQRLNTLLGGVP
jgi:hypothetical protein